MFLFFSLKSYYSLIFFKRLTFMWKIDVLIIIGLLEFDIRILSFNRLFDRWFIQKFLLKKSGKIKIKSKVFLNNCQQQQVIFNYFFTISFSSNSYNWFSFSVNTKRYQRLVTVTVTYDKRKTNCNILRKQPA